jgi:uncharacterized lipoprotein YmbA
MPPFNCRPCLALLATLLAAGCAKAPPPDFFLLDAAAPSQLPGFEQGLSVGVGPVEIARHLDRNQIVSRESDTKLKLSDRNQWAEPLKAGFTRVLLINLGLELDSNRVYALPMRQRLPLDYRVEVDLVRFDGVLGREVILAARWALMRGDKREILTSKVSRIREPVQGDDYAAFTTAQSRAVARLGREIAAAIKRRASP